MICQILALASLVERGDRLTLLPPGFPGRSGRIAFSSGFSETFPSTCPRPEAFLELPFCPGSVRIAMGCPEQFTARCAQALERSLKLGRVYRFYRPRGGLENRGNRGRYRLPRTELLDCGLQKCHPRSRRVGEGVEIPTLSRCRKDEKRLALRSAELKDAWCGSPACYEFWMAQAFWRPQTATVLRLSSRDSSTTRLNPYSPPIAADRFEPT